MFTVSQNLVSNSGINILNPPRYGPKNQSFNLNLNRNMVKAKIHFEQLSIAENDRLKFALTNPMYICKPLMPSNSHGRR